MKHSLLTAIALFASFTVLLKLISPLLQHSEWPESASDFKHH